MGNTVYRPEEVIEKAVYGNAFVYFINLILSEEENDV